MSDFRWAWVDWVEGPDSGASMGARYLANVLVRHFVPQGQDVCWPGVRRVAELMNVSHTTVRVRFDELEALGCLPTTRRENGRSNLRRLVIPDPEAVSTGMPVSTVRRPRGGRSEGSGMPASTVSGWLEAKRATKTGMPVGTHRANGHSRTTLTPLNVRKPDTHAHEVPLLALADDRARWCSPPALDVA